VAVAAFFDVDGTLTRTTALHPLVWYQRGRLGRLRFALWAAGLLAQAPWYWWIDRRDRRRFNLTFFRRYAGLNVADLGAWHTRTFVDNLERVLYPAGVECVREHQRQGRRVVLVTGGLDVVMRPLADVLKADELLCGRLCERDGVCTGALLDEPLTGERKAALMREYAEKHGIDLAESYAYGDSAGDLPMLECVGHAVVVNPGRRLRALAEERGWQVVRWTC
jgi:HAD superfamily hydrolase (TIGR01490 family)